MNPSEIKSGLDDIAVTIRNARSRLLQAKANIQNTYAELNSIPTTYASLISAIDAFVPTGAFESLAKDEKSKLTSEFIALRNDASGASAALNSYLFQ